MALKINIVFRTMPMTYLYARRLLWTIIVIPITRLTLITLYNKSILVRWHILSVASCEVIVPIIFDIKGCLFRFVVIFISANVLHFSHSYISDEIFPKRFTILVLIFILSINILIYIPHLITLLIGWDGLGVISFALVIYYQNPKSLGAGIITALINRVGDVIIIISIALILNLGHWGITTLWSRNEILLWTILILVARITKSAQIPFSRWLPAAIAAPTPVSALVHSSTLVTAGVFLIIRFHYFLSGSLYFNITLLLIATTTIFIAGTAAIAECDIKKIIALSTLRQLGVIIGALGLGATDFAFFHLLTHALFKALLFLTAGRAIHHFSHSQDLRQIGGVNNSNPVLSSALIVANISLCGGPFLAGFYSKDLILETSLFWAFRPLILLLFFGATALTAIYSIRITIITVWGTTNRPPIIYSSDEETTITTPIITLASAAVSSGALILWFIIFQSGEILLPPHFKFLTISVVFFGILSSLFIIKRNISLIKKTTFINFSLATIWFLRPTIAQGAISKSFYQIKTVIKLIDHGWIEYLGAQGSFNYFSSISKPILQPHQKLITSNLALSLRTIITITIFMCKSSLYH